ncbi:MAG: hypothetical protein IJK89_06085 [Clostridia bacterium]|nr:hypothetical protein [Clostridia bacterium]
MILLIDADILLRAALFPAGEAAAALKKALAAPFRPHVRESVWDELRRLLAELCPDAREETEAFLSVLTETVAVIPAPEGADSRSAPDDSVNLFLTGDRELLAAGDPRILDAGEFLAF